MSLQSEIRIARRKVRSVTVSYTTKCFQVWYGEKNEQQIRNIPRKTNSLFTLYENTFSSTYRCLSTAGLAALRLFESALAASLQQRFNGLCISHWGTTSNSVVREGEGKCHGRSSPVGTIENRLHDSRNAKSLPKRTNMRAGTWRRHDGILVLAQLG